MSRCVIVKSGVRCTNDSQSFAYGLTLPLLVPDSPPCYICGDCIYSMYQEMTAGDFKQATINPNQVRKEMGLR